MLNSLMNVMVVELIHGSIIFFVHSQSLTLYQMSIQLELDLIYLITFLSALLYMWSPWLTRVPPFLLLLPLRSASSSSKSHYILWQEASSSDIEEYQKQSLPLLPVHLVNCTLTDCSCHHELLDNYTLQLVTCLRHSASQCFPCHSPSKSRQSLVGWKDPEGPHKLRDYANFWYKMWEQAGCPSSGALCDIKKRTKRKYKTSVRRLKRKQQHLLRNKLARSFSSRRNNKFWSKVRQLNRSSTSSSSSIVDGVSGARNIANLMASKFRSLLNTHSPALRDSLYDTLQSSVSTSQLQDVVVTCEDVIKAIHRVKSGKFDPDGLSSEHLRFACPVIADSLASLFTACLRHGYMLKGIRDCILIHFLKTIKITLAARTTDLLLLPPP